MSNEFTESIGEGMDELLEAAGKMWVWESKSKELPALQGNDKGTFDLMSGSTDFKRSVDLLCRASDFPDGFPQKRDIFFRKAAPNVKYWVKEDASIENEIDPTFTLKLELKH